MICVPGNLLVRWVKRQRIFMESSFAIVSVILANELLVVSLDATISKVISGTRTWTSQSMSHNATPGSRL